MCQMQMLRALILGHRALATVLVLAALCLKLAMPAGFMIEQNSKVLTVRICNDAFGDQGLSQIVIPMQDVGPGSGAQQGKGECAFASLSFGSLSAAAPALLVIALGFILALGFAAARLPLPQRALFLRPPLRGPPAIA